MQINEKSRFKNETGFKYIGASSEAEEILKALTLF
jgi:hypothetical protein